MRNVIFFLMSFFVTACATPYQEVGLLGGFTEKQLDKDVVQLGLLGNGFTSYTRAESMVLLKSSELSLASGYDRFILLPYDDSTRSLENPGALRELARTGNRGGREGLTSIKEIRSTIYVNGMTVPSSRIDGAVIIVMFKSSDASAPKGIDARETSERLRPRLVPQQTPAPGKPEEGKQKADKSA